MPDDLPEPPILADIRSYGVDVFAWCNRCHHHAVLPIAVLIAHCSPGPPFPAACGVRRAGSKDIHARPNWKGLGQVAGHGPSKQETADRGDYNIPEWTI